MATMRSANPALNPKTFTGLPAVGAEPMTLQGTVNKTAILLICVHRSLLPQIPVVCTEFGSILACSDNGGNEKVRTHA